MRQKSFEFRQLIKSCIEVLLHRKLENVVETIPIQSNDDNAIAIIILMTMEIAMLIRLQGVGAGMGRFQVTPRRKKKVLFQK